MIEVKVTVFLKCLNATIPLTWSLANEYPSSNEISKKNSMVRGDCIACDALLSQFLGVFLPTLIICNSVVVKMFVRLSI